MDLSNAGMLYPIGAGDTVAAGTLAAWQYLHHNSGLYPKIQFSNLYNIKELHPYVQVLRAILEIKPVSGSYGINTFYQLPSLLELRVTDDDNGINDMDRFLG